MVWRRPNDWGTLLLAIWLIVFGAIPLLNIQFTHSGLVVSALAIVAGVLILVGR